MIYAIVFDCFGVLMTDAWLPFKAKAFGHDPELLQEATNLMRQSDAGMLSHDDFITSISELASMPASQAKKAIENNAANEPLFLYIQELKKDYKIGLLSNAADNWLDHMFTPEQIKAFDAVALSYEMRHVKPDPRAYEIIAERLGVEVGECVFVDDQERYCTGAREAGMKAVRYKNDVDQMRIELNKLLSS